MNKDFMNENNLKKGSKNVSSCKNCVQNFRCKVNGCPFCYRLIINNNEEKVKLEKSMADHNHEGFDQRDWDVQKEVLEKIYHDKISFVNFINKRFLHHIASSCHHQKIFFK
jgi:hypothetical protein